MGQCLSEELGAEVPRQVGRYLRAERRAIHRLLAVGIFTLVICVLLGFVEPAFLGGLPVVLYVGGFQLGHRWSTYRQVRNARQWRTGRIAVITSGAWMGARASGSLELEGQVWDLATVRKKNGWVPTSPVSRHVLVCSEQRSRFRPAIALDGHHSAWRCSGARALPRSAEERS